MALYGKNTEVREVRDGSLIPDCKNFTASWISYNQGSTLIFDATSNVVRAATAESECSTFLGIAQADVVAGVLRSPYATQVDGSTGLLSASIDGPVYGSSFQMQARAGDAYAPGAPVFAAPTTWSSTVGGPSNYVASTGTKQIGVYLGPTIASSTAGQVIEVMIGARWPNDTLKF